MGEQKHTAELTFAGKAGKAKSAGWTVWKDGNGYRATSPKGDWDSEKFPTMVLAWDCAIAKAEGRS